MRKEVEEWIKTADQDFDNAKYVFDGTRFSLAAFLCQQSVEKALKALFVHKKKADVPRSHSLIFLAKQTGVPRQFHPFLRELTPAFIDTRYPDADTEAQDSIYDEDDTKRILDKSREVLKWIRKEL